MNKNKYEVTFANMLKGLDLTLAKDENGGYILYDYLKGEAFLNEGFSETYREQSNGELYYHDVSEYTGKMNVTTRDIYNAIPENYTDDRYWSMEGIEDEFKMRFPEAEWDYSYAEMSKEGWLEFAKNPTEKEVGLSNTVPFAECEIIKEFDLICNHLDDVDIENVYKLLHPDAIQERGERVRTQEKTSEAKKDKEKPKKKSSHEYER